jgi:hypothetical protein
MDFDTALLLAVTVIAFGWFFSIRINEERKYIKACQEKEIDRMQRAERVKILSSR